MAREIKMTDTQFKAVEDGRMESNDLETVEITKEYLEYLEDAEKSLEQQRERNNKLAYDKRLKEIELAGAKILNKVLGELQEEHEGMVQAATLQHLDFFRAKAKFGTESADLFIEKSKENEELRKKVDDLWNEILKREEVENGLKAENRNLKAEIQGLKDRIKKWKSNQPGIQNVDSGDIGSKETGNEPQTLIPNDIEETLKIIKDRFTSFGAYSQTEVANKLRKYIIDRETTLHEMMDKLAAAGKKRRKERDLINAIESHIYKDPLGHKLTHLLTFDDLIRSLNEPIK